MLEDSEKMLKIAVQIRKAQSSYQDKLPKEAVPVGHFIDRTVITDAGRTRILIYTPKQQTQVRYPVFVSLHGGGFILGSAEDDDVWCRKIANAVNCVVVNIDYPLAPECKFPIPLEESYAVVKWVHDHAEELGIDSGRIAVGGHSAGGNLAAAICLLARDRREFPIIYQILDYAVLDNSIDAYNKHLHPEETMLTPKLVNLFTACYIRSEEDTKNPFVSPLLEKNLQELPPALIIAAEFDPLYEEDRLYAERLADAGIEVVFRKFSGCCHAFTHFGPEEAANAAWALIYSQLRRAFKNALPKGGKENG
ncbi:alpha/beta hydrolase [Sporomusa acidovorans]|uniref:Carboxylesterase NlhH n=1 Tax=Sporomusa acidovorans (strain ATCC 49682 / DSM 3132 / Mol) TaxID=1123286 RepID=A0ABZ3JAL7_SPOA4|nr:alpha/beta hydrolase [Sporomusa acidovorans]OZC13203.1 carboxylesterase NlhH [Sporomusa acidovorans DSM 3132]SDE01298.1 acetyl esterase [Sporomusa acidovorans]